MKKLILAPAIALAVAGLTAAPAIANTADTEAETPSAGESATTAASDSADPEGPGGFSEAPADTAPSTRPTDRTSDDSSGTDKIEQPVDSGKKQTGDGTRPDVQANDSVSPTPEASDAVDPINVVIDAPATVTQAEIRSSGIDITVSGLEPGDVVELNLTKLDVELKPQTASGGSVNFTVRSPYGLDAGEREPFTVKVSRDGVEEPQVLFGLFTVVADEPGHEGKLVLAADTMTVSEFMSTGLNFTASGLEPGYDAGARAYSDDHAQDEIYFDDFYVHADGTFSGVVTPNVVDSVKPGKYVLAARDESQVVYAEFTLVSDSEIPAEASLTVTPKKLEAGDFVNEKKGVTLTVKDCKPGEDVRFQVNPKGLKVTAYDRTVKADENGAASVTVYGTSSDSSAYVGDYTVTATCGDDTLKGAFTVTSAAKGGGDDGNDDTDKGDNSDDDNTTTVTPGSDLPRTGIDLGGLQAGALLLLVGGAAVTLTGRRKKMSSAPSEI